MQFLVKKEDLFNGLKMVEKATSQKGLQPVLGNILIETIDKSTIKLSATDLDLTIITSVDAQIQQEGKITLPARKLSDIISRVGDKLVSFELEEGSHLVKIECEKTKFELQGISADEFPAFADYLELEDEYCCDVELNPFIKSIKQAGFAAASYEGNNLLSGIVCNVSDKTLEMASTDGNRLARIREAIENKDGKSSQMIIPSKTLNEFVKMGSAEEEPVKLYNFKSRMVLKTEKVMMISRLLEGAYPKYNQLIPQQSPKEAIIKIDDLITALERVSVMVNDKTNIVKFEFNENKLILKADTPEAGKSEDEIEIEYAEEELIIAFNYKYVLECLKNMDSDEVIIGLNTPLSATVLKPKNEEDFVCIVMPVQIR